MECAYLSSILFANMYIYCKFKFLYVFGAQILETHSVTGEYGHPFHIIVHKVIMHILKTMNSNTRPRSVKVFSLDGNEGGTLVNKKVQALEEIYQIPNNTFWEQIKGSESVEFSYENLSDKMYDSVASHLCM